MPNNRSIYSLAGKVAKRTGLDRKIVYDTYMAYWRYIKDYVSKFNLWDGLDEEEFNKLQVNVNIPHIGKLYVTYPRYLNCRRRWKLIKEHRDAKDKES